MAILHDPIVTHIPALASYHTISRPRPSCTLLNNVPVRFISRGGLNPFTKFEEMVYNSQSQYDLYRVMIMKYLFEMQSKVNEEMDTLNRSLLEGLLA